MATIGELSDLGVADLIEILTRRGRTGRLQVKTGGQAIDLHFEGGRLLMVSTTDITLRLGRMLVRQGLLDTPRLLEALHEQAETGDKKPLGAILRARGWITEADLHRCVEEQAVEAMAQAVIDQAGIFVFDAGATRPGHVEPLPLDPGLLLRAAHERTDALRMLKAQLPPPGAPLMLNPAAPITADATDELDASEAMVASVLRGGAKTYAELSFHLALDELSLGVAVLALIERGAVMTAAGAHNGRAVARA